MLREWQATARRAPKRRLRLESLEARKMLATLPNGFTDTQVGATLNAPPVSLLETPDGRILVTTERDDRGAIHVIKNGSLLPNPALQIDVVSEGEFGMVGAVLDPNFSQNGYIFVMYTTNQGGLHNRLSRFQFEGDTISVSTEQVIFEFNLLGEGTVHNGGGMAFGADGKLYIGVGDNANSAHARTLNNHFGKILRINPDGTIPTDNPFYDQATETNRAIYAIGVRNPYTMDADPTTGKIFFNDVGPAGPEEINEVKRGADFAWPLRVGASTDPAHTSPVYSYRHNASSPEGCAITGGSFSRTSNTAIPAQFRDVYFFTDYCGNWIDALNPSTGQATRFASDVAAGPVSLHVDASGSLYYLSRQTKTVRKISYASSETPATISQQPQNTSTPAGTAATFSVQVSGATPTAYQWQRRIGTADFTDILSATASSYTLTSPSASDNNSDFRVIVTTPTGTLTSSSARLTVTNGHPPVPVIETPGSSDKYVAGDVINFSGYATDPDHSGNLPLSNLTWEVTFQHDEHDHPELAPFSGASGGSFRVPLEGETSANTWFRIHLTAIDSTGLSTYTFRDIFPVKSFFTIAANVPGIELLLDGTPVPASTRTEGVVGVRRSIGAPVTQTIGGRTYRFVQWSHGGERVQTISTPATSQTYTAIFEEDGGTDPGPGGLITHFTLDEGQGLSGADSAPVGRPDTASLTNGATWTTSGRTGAAVRFDGVNDFLAIPDSTDINNRDTAKTTVAFWFNADNVNRLGTQVLFKQSGSSRGLNVYLSGGRLYVGGWSSKANWEGTFLSTNLISSNRWHHVALVLDAENTLRPDAIRGYLDGNLFASGQGATIETHLSNVSFGASDEATKLHTGASSAKVLNAFAGFIDDVRFYDRPLTATELATLAGGTTTPSVKVSVNDVSGNEGNQGNTPFRFTVSLDKPITHNFSVRVDTADVGSAVAGTDYQSLVNRIVMIPAGSTSATLDVLVLGDTLVEGNDTFSVRLSNPVVEEHLGHDHAEKVELGKSAGVGTVLNDDSSGGGGSIANLVTHYGFDEGSGTLSSDIAPFGVPDPATLTNGATWSTVSVSGRSVQFDGINDFVAIPDSVDLNDRDVAKTTISLWFNANDVSRPGKQTLFKQNGNTRGLNIYLESGQLYVGGFSDDSNWSGTFLSTNAIRSGQWHHVALVLDAGASLTPNSLLGYLDGSLFGSGAGASFKKHLGNVSLGALDQATRFHNGNSSGVAPYVGLIDEFRLYHRSLSAAEIQSLAASTTTVTSMAASLRSSESINLFSLPAPSGTSDPLAQSRMDISGDGIVTALDALRVINKISVDRAKLSAEGETAFSLDDHYDERFDVNDDGLVTAADALAIINHMARVARQQSSVALTPPIDDDFDSTDATWDAAIVELGVLS